MKFLIGLIILSVLASCTKEEAGADTPSGGLQKVAVTASITSNNTKLTFTESDADVKVDWDASGESFSAVVGSSVYAFSQKEGNTFEGLLPEDASAIYAVYPEITGSVKGPNAINIDLSTQSGTSLDESNTYMCARKTSLSDFTHNLQFEHLTSVAKVTLSFGVTSGTATDVKVSGSGLANGATVDLTGEEPVYTSKYGEISCGNLAITNGEAVIYIHLLPTTTCDITISAKIDGDLYYATLPARSSALQAGYVYLASASMKSLVGIEWESEYTNPLGGIYARHIRLQDGTHLMVHEYGSRSVVRIYDEAAGKYGDRITGIPAKTINEITLNAANPEIKQLRDGSLIMAANYRPATQDVEGVNYSIAVVKSTDGGKTWTSPKIIFEAGNNSGTGCWEPVFLELPDGTLQLYCASEKRYDSSAATYQYDQDIIMLTSDDGGLTWSDEVTYVSHRPKYRDGMPVPVILGDEIVVAIEDNGDGWFKPFTVRTSLNNPWPSTIEAGSEYRKSSTKYYSRGANVYAGAPYLIQIDGMHTLLSYQILEERNTGVSGQTNACTVEVALGNADATEFSDYQRPVTLTEGQGALWNSLSMWDEDTVVLVSSIRTDSGSTVVMTKGHLIYK